MFFFSTVELNIIVGIFLNKLQEEVNNPKRLEKAIFRSEKKNTRSYFKKYS